MSRELASEVEELLQDMLQTQEELSGIYRDKREAIRRADAVSMDRLTDREERLIAVLKSHLQRRQRILQRAAADAEAGASLEGLAKTFAPHDRERLRPLFDRNRRAADANRRESWVVWIVSQQSLRLFADVIDLIANGGHKAPVYSSQKEASLTFGGAILDASA